MKHLFLIVFLNLSLLIQAQNSTNSSVSNEKGSKVTFFGNNDADLFSRELSESFQGVLQYNYIINDSVFPPGFVHASPVPQAWSNTFWTRDGGTFLRELVQWGYINHACMTANCLIDLVAKNPEGYYSFPEYFDSKKPKSGDELDGTSSIIIGMALLYKHLPSENPLKQKIFNFLHQPSSPVAYIEYQLKGKPLLKGEGEFGGGCGIKGFYCNIVQNNLSSLALLAVSEMERSAGNTKRATDLSSKADKLFKNMQQYMIDTDGSWIWCISPETLKPAEKINNDTINRGFGGLNGILSMSADVLGFEPAVSAKPIFNPSLKTFAKLYNTPLRKEQFEKHGIWTQFDVYGAGLITSPSYGQAYAMQAMLLLDSLEMVSKALKFMAQQTYHPVPGYDLHRKSEYYIYERMYSPEAIGKVELVEGCGALNLVNVTENLKVARLMIGIDDSDPDTLKLMPKLPSEWNGFTTTDFPVYTKSGMTNASINYSINNNRVRFSFKSSKKVKVIKLRLPNGKGWKWYTKENSDTIIIN